MRITLLFLCSVFSGFSAEIVCPNALSECPDESTCCLMDNDKYGCCPLKDAVCCSDQAHCCPNGFSCDRSLKVCFRGNEITSMVKKVPSRPKITAETTPLRLLRSPMKDPNTIGWHYCPDLYTQCRNIHTCCLSPEDQFECCTYMYATCCRDREMCCPNGYLCDSYSRTCYAPYKTRKPVLQQVVQANEVQEASAESLTGCKPGQTLCSFHLDRVYCCPHSTVCCNDKKHCCPKGFYCNMGYSACIRAEVRIPASRKIPGVH